MVTDARTPLPQPAWRARVAVVLGVGIVLTGGVLGLTMRPAWPWAPVWLTDSAPYGIAIGTMILGLFVLGEVWSWAKRLWRTIAGSALLLAGLAMLVLPGPGLVTIAAGLFVLSREYDWASRQYDRVENRVRAAKARAQVAMAARRDARTAQRQPPPAVMRPLAPVEDEPSTAGDEPLPKQRECA